MVSVVTIAERMSIIHISVTSCTYLPSQTLSLPMEVLAAEKEPLPRPCAVPGVPASPLLSTCEYHSITIREKTSLRVPGKRAEAHLCLSTL